MTKDPYANMGARLVKEVASKTNDVAGDRETTSADFARSMIYNGIKSIEAGENPVVVKKSMEKSLVFAVETIKANAIENSNKHVG